MSDAKSYPAWISVEDQLPENSDFVLAVVNGNYKEIKKKEEGKDGL